MSYSDKEMGRERLAAAGLVVLVQGGVIAALVSGLALTVMTEPDRPLVTYPVPEMAPPPPDRVEAKPEARARPVAESSVPTPFVPSPINPVLPVPERLFVDVGPVGPVDIPQPEPSAVDLAKGASARGSVGAWFPQDSYPPAALRAQVEGRVGVALTVLPTGRGSTCEVVSTSGNVDLDQATCRLALKNGRFQPARDGQGNAVAARIVLPSVRWRIVE